MMCALREVREDGEGERQVERLVERQSLRDEVRPGQRRRHPALPADLEDLIHWVASVQRARSDVARQVAGEAAPAAPVVEHRGIGQGEVGMLAEPVAQLGVEGLALVGQHGAAGPVPELLERRVGNARQQRADVRIRLVLLGQEERPEIDVEVPEQRERVLVRVCARLLDAPEALAVEVLQPRVVVAGLGGGRRAPRPRRVGGTPPHPRTERTRSVAEGAQRPCHAPADR